TLPSPLADLTPQNVQSNFTGFDQIESQILSGIDDADPAKPAVQRFLDFFGSGALADHVSLTSAFLGDPIGGLFSILQGMDVELFHLKAAFQDSHGFDSGLLPLNLVAAPALIDIAGSYSIDVNVEIGYDTFGIREFIGDVIQNPPADLDSLLTPALDLLD